MSTERKKSRRENPLVSLAVNIVIPVIILVRFSGEDQLGPVNGLLVALAFPVGYGLYDFIVRRGFNPYSMLGFASVLLTGGIGLLKLPVEWLAIKEAAIPFIICVAVVVSMRTPYPLVKTIMHKVINVERVYEALERRQSVEAYERGDGGHVHDRVRAARVYGPELRAGAGCGGERAGDDGIQRGAWTHDGAELSGHHGTVDNHPRFALYYLGSGITKETGLEFQDIFKTTGDDE